MTLLPCPLCSSPVTFIFNPDYYAEFEFRIECTHCELVLPSRGGERIDDQWVPDLETEVKWNTRPEAQL